MGEDHSPANLTPHKTMISTHVGFPYTTDHQLIVNMANSAKQTISCLKYIDARTAPIDEQFQKRVHELMHFRSHTVDTDGF